MHPYITKTSVLRTIFFSPVKVKCMEYNPDIREGTFFLRGGGLGPQRGGSSVKVSTKGGGPYLM